MINFNVSHSAAIENVGAVRVQVKLINAVDEELVKRGLLNSILRVYETEAWTVEQH